MKHDRRWKSWAPCIAVLFVAGGSGCDEKTKASTSTRSRTNSIASASSTARGRCLGGKVHHYDDCSTAADENCDGKTPRCSGTEQWSKRFGGKGVQRFTALATTPKGGAYVAGFFRAEIELGKGLRFKDKTLPLKSDQSIPRNDAFVGRLDDAGGFLWAVQLTGDRDQNVYDLAVDSQDNLVVGGTTSGRLKLGDADLCRPQVGVNDAGFVAKLGPKGKALWCECFDGYGNTGSVVTGVAVDKQNHIWVSARHQERSYLTRLSPKGKQIFEWFGTESGQGASEARDVAIDPQGDGWVIGAFDLSLHHQNKRILGFSPRTGYAAKLGPNGELRWVKSLGTKNKPQHLVIDSAGNGFITTQMSQPLDWSGTKLGLGPGSGLLMSLDSDGKPRFVRQFSGWSIFDRLDLYTKLHPRSGTRFIGEWETGALVDVDPAGNPTVAVTFTGEFKFGAQKLKTSVPRDIALLKFNQAGKSLWLRAAGGKAGKFVHALKVDAQGRAWLGGAYVDKANAYLSRVAP